ncbi:hypothetical protein GCM10027162_62300 [Streptomyces incanus]
MRAAVLTGRTESPFAASVQLQAHCNKRPKGAVPVHTPPDLPPDLPYDCYEPSSGCP